MRVTVSHNKPPAEIKQAVDRSFDNLFANLGIAPLQIVDEQRSWQGSTMTFAFKAKMGIVSTPIKGFVEITDKDMTVDADLGFLERLLSGSRARATIESRVKGLLQ